MWDSSRSPERFWIHVTALAILSFHRLAVRVGVSRETGQDALATADKMPALQFETND